MAAVNEFGDVALEQATNEFGDVALVPSQNEFGDPAIQSKSLDITVPAGRPGISTTQGGPRASLASPSVLAADLAPQAGEVITDVATHPSPIPTPFEVKPTDLPETALIKAAINTAVGVPQFFTSGPGIAALAAGAVAPALTAGAFTADLLHSLGTQMKDTYQNWDKLTEAQKIEAGMQMAGTAAFAKLAHRQLMKETSAPIIKGAAPVQEKGVMVEPQPKLPPISEEAKALLPLTVKAMEEVSGQTVPSAEIAPPKVEEKIGQPADEFGAVFGPNIGKSGYEKLRGESEGFEVQELPSGDPSISHTLSIRNGKLWLVTERSSDVLFKPQAVTALAVKPDGETVMTGSFSSPGHPNPELAELGKQKLADYISKWMQEPLRTEKSAVPEVNPVETKADLQAQLDAEMNTDVGPGKPVDVNKQKGLKWATATDESLPTQELYAGIPNPVVVAKNVASIAKFAGKKISPFVRLGADAVTEIAKEVYSLDKVSDVRRSVLRWSGKLQTSFNEAAQAQREIQSKVPDKGRQEGITNWLQSDGDATVLRARRDATVDPNLRAGYDAALTLTPEEIQVAADVRAAYDSLGSRGQANDVLGNFKENYVTQIWDLGKGPAIGGSRTLKEKFRFSKASTFPTFFDGEQAGFVPKTKAIGDLLPVYLHEMNSVIAARQLVSELSKGKASDGRPLVSARGGASVIEKPPEGTVTLVNPEIVNPGRSKASPELNYRGDYKTINNQPALHDWRMVEGFGTDNPIYLKADLALHPEAYKRLNAALGRSAIKEWYESKTTAMAGIPKGLARLVDVSQAETKRTMLGFFAPFHQVQEGTHAVGHRVSPVTNIPKIDLVGNPNQRDAVNHGLMLQPDRASADQFMEGFKTSGLVSRIPAIGPLADFYSHYLFHEYIPGLKSKTYDAILERNKKVYASELKSGEVNLEDVKVLSAEQANAAYGHLNYSDLGRNPTMQHVAQLALLAPDFLEARARFAGQALKGSTGLKVGREQMLAVATLAIAQATLAYIGAKTTGGEWDASDPFEFKVGSRKYSMRSVPEDLQRLLTDTRAFSYSRLNPLVGKGLVQGFSGVDWRGQKVTLSETAKELLVQPIPITLRALTGTSKSSLSAWEQMAGAAGIVIRRNYQNSELNALHSEWLRNNPDPKIRDDFERSQKATYPTSVYADLDNALRDDNQKKAKDALQKLRSSGREDADIAKRMKPKGSLFHESKKMESDFLASLDSDGKQKYDAAIQRREQEYQTFLKVAADLKMKIPGQKLTAEEFQKELDAIRKKRR